MFTQDAIESPKSGNELFRLIELDGMMNATCFYLVSFMCAYTLCFINVAVLHLNEAKLLSMPATWVASPGFDSTTKVRLLDISFLVEREN